jgi:hypothetical protein
VFCVSQFKQSYRVKKIRRFVLRCSFGRYLTAGSKGSNSENAAIFLCPSLFVRDKAQNTGLLSKVCIGRQAFKDVTMNFVRKKRKKAYDSKTANQPQSN